MKFKIGMDHRPLFGATTDAELAVILEPQLTACQNGPTKRFQWMLSRKTADRVRARRSFGGLLFWRRNLGLF